MTNKDGIFYRHELPNGKKEYVSIDPVTGTRTVLHESLLKRFSKWIRRKVGLCEAGFRHDWVYSQNGCYCACKNCEIAYDFIKYDFGFRFIWESAWRKI
jgi:hypothetical protein